MSDMPIDVASDLQKAMDRNRYSSTVLGVLLLLSMTFTPLPHFDDIVTLLLFPVGIYHLILIKRFAIVLAKKDYGNAPDDIIQSYKLSGYLLLIVLTVLGICGVLAA